MNNYFSRESTEALGLTEPLTRLSFPISRVIQASRAHRSTVDSTGEDGMVLLQESRDALVSFCIVCRCNSSIKMREPRISAIRVIAQVLLMERPGLDAVMKTILDWRPRMHKMRGSPRLRLCEVIFCHRSFKGVS